MTTAKLLITAGNGIAVSLSLDYCPWCYWLVMLRNDKKAVETR